MKTRNGKFFIGIGILLVLAGILIFPDDDIIGILGVFLGAYNVVKGIRLLRGIQPMLIRKQQVKKRQEEKEMNDQMNEAEKKQKQ